MVIRSRYWSKTQTKVINFFFLCNVNLKSINNTGWPYAITAQNRTKACSITGLLITWLGICSVSLAAWSYRSLRSVQHTTVISWNTSAYWSPERDLLEDTSSARWGLINPLTHHKLVGKERSGWNTSGLLQIYLDVLYWRWVSLGYCMCRINLFHICNGTGAPCF